MRASRGSKNLITAGRRWWILNISASGEEDHQYREARQTMNTQEIQKSAISTAQLNVL